VSAVIAVTALTAQPAAEAKTIRPSTSLNLPVVAAGISADSSETHPDSKMRDDFITLSTVPEQA